MINEKQAGIHNMYKINFQEPIHIHLAHIYSYSHKKASNYLQYLLFILSLHKIGCISA